MTTSVTITNNGPARINVNEIEPVGPKMADKRQTVQAHTLEMGQSVTIHVWGDDHYLCVLETNDVDSAESSAPSNDGDAP